MKSDSLGLLSSIQNHNHEDNSLIRTNLFVGFFFKKKKKKERAATALTNQGSQHFLSP